MDRKLAKFFGIYKDIDVNYRDNVSELVLDLPTLEDNGLKEVLDEIFATDPKTGQPKGDIQYFLSKDGNPQVKAFIESVLFSNSRSQNMYDPVTISDDLIVEYSRKPNESVSDYVSRLGGYRETALKEIKKLKNPENV